MPWKDTARVEHRRDASRYPSDLTDREWALIAPLLPAAKRGGRPRTTRRFPRFRAIFMGGATAVFGRPSTTCW